LYVPPTSDLRLDYDYDYDYEHEHEFFICASSFLALVLVRCVGSRDLADCYWR
jgi:hypothetical protein